MSTLNEKQKAALNEAAIQALNTYMTKVSEIFDDEFQIKENMTGHMHIHTGMAVSSENGKPILGLRVTFECLSVLELNALLGIKTMGNA